MKKIVESLLFAAMAAVTLSCTKENRTSAEPGECVVCHFFLASSDDDGTKSTGLESDEGGNAAEKAVGSLQVFVFGSDGHLVASEGTENAKSLSMSVNSGTGYSIYAVCNAEDWRSDVATVADLRSKVSEVLGTEEGASKFVMKGCLEDQIISAGSKEFTIAVERCAAKVVLRQVTNSLPAALGDISIDGIYLSNVVTSSALFADALPEGAVWVNKMGDYDKLSGFGWFDEKFETAVTVPNASAYETPHTFYAAANPTAVDANAGEEFSARFTRLVLKTTVQGAVYYYPVSFNRELPELTPNSYIDITNLNIKHLGSQDPDIPVSTDNIAVTVEVKAWNHMEKNVEL